MAATSLLNYVYFAHFSQPKSDRQIYRWIKRSRAVKIVEVGITSLKRSTSLIEVAHRYAGDKIVSYTGFDWFEARSGHLPGLTLKQVHHAMQKTAAQVRLMPGPPCGSLISGANSLQGTDLLIISSAVLEADLAPVWYYVPRMLQKGSLVLREEESTEGERSYVLLSEKELQDLADRSYHRRAA